MASSFGYSSDTPEGCWDDLRHRICSRSHWPDHQLYCRDRLAGRELDRQSIRDCGCRERLVGPAGTGPPCDDRRLARGDRRAGTLGVESGLAVGLYQEIVELLKSIESHLAEGYRRVKIKIRPGSDVSSLCRTVRQHFGEIPLMVDGNEQLHSGRHRCLSRARRV